MNQTNHYQLSQWEPTDRILMENFNGDNQKVDAALKANADAAASAAAAFSGLSAATPRFEVGTYTGTGQYGQNHKTTITFSMKPLAVMVVGGSYQATSLFLRPGISGAANDTAGRGGVLALTWGENSLAWYITGSANGGSSSTATSAAGQLNESGKTYTYLALCEGN